MVDRKSLRFSAVLLIAGEVVYQVAELFHPEGGITATDCFTAHFGHHLSPTSSINCFDPQYLSHEFCK